MSCFNDDELSKLKATCFRGFARVQLNALNFDHPLVQQKHRKVLQKNVRRLHKIFEKIGCLRLQEENFINAVIDDASLDDAVAVSQVSRDELLNLREGQELPLLNLRNVECLSGLHRTEAAKAFLNDNDQWWTVRLFSKETPRPVLSRIIELYSNEQRPSDGDIFRKILLYSRSDDGLSENQWWAYLDNSKPKDLRQLLKNRLLASAFGCLVDMPGLWTKIQLGALHRLLALKCVEEMIRYLNHIKRTWDIILRCGHTTLPYSVVDDVTAEKLEGLCPKYSTSDKDYVRELMENHTIFPSVLDESLRQVLLPNIISISTLIPSLRTFFETLKYLEPLCEILKRLIGNKMKGTIRASLLGCFFPPEKIMVQKSKSHDVELKTQPDKAKVADIAYLQLWAFCGRHFDDLTTFTPRKENGKDKPVIKEPNPVLWQRLARFALDLGFRTSEVERLAIQDSCSKLAIDYLTKANPLSANFSTSQIERVVLAGSGLQGLVEELPEFNLTQLDVERRFGRPFEPDLEEDKRRLFVPIIYQDQDSPVVNLQFIRRDLFLCIFGPFRFNENDFGPPVPSILSQETIPSTENIPLTSTETRKRTEPSDEPDGYARKKRRLDEIDQLNGEIQGLKERVASLIRANKSLRADRSILEERFRAAEHGNRYVPPQSSQIDNLNIPDAPDVNRTVENLDAQDNGQSSVVPQHVPTQVHQETHDNSQAIVLRNDPLSLDVMGDLDPGVNLIQQLFASYRHTYSDLGSGEKCEIFLIRKILGEKEIEGLSFPISSSEDGVRQVEMLMEYINSFWTEVLRTPGPSIVSKSGRMVENSAKSIHGACQWKGTCFVGARDNVDKYIQIIDDDEL